MLTIEHNCAEFIGCLICDDISFCELLEKHLRGYYGMSVETIGSSDLALVSSRLLQGPPVDSNEKDRRLA
jgi:hypothetical protein